MPKIDQKLINSVCFLFATEEAAIAGKYPGGTAFIVGMQIADTIASFYYCVSCHHVVMSGNQFIRLRKFDGSVDIINIPTEEWQFSPDIGDAAACRLYINETTHAFSVIHSSSFLTREIVADREIGIGEDIFMLGVFDEETGLRYSNVNAPVARFGNISMMPSTAGMILERPFGYKQRFIIDMHSRSGFSGSPVFVFRVANADVTKEDTNDFPFFSNNIFRLLGLHVGQFPEYWKAKHNGGELTIRGVSGMTIAVPAWDLTKLLACQAFADDRAATGAQFSG